MFVPLFNSSDWICISSCRAGGLPSIPPCYRQSSPCFSPPPTSHHTLPPSSLSTSLPVTETRVETCQDRFFKPLRHLQSNPTGPAESEDLFSASVPAAHTSTPSAGCRSDAAEAPTRPKTRAQVTHTASNTVHEVVERS